MPQGLNTRLSLLRHAVKLFPRLDYIDDHAVRHLRRRWFDATRALGDRHILAQPVARKGS